MMNHADEEQNEMTLLVSMIAFRHTARAVIGPTKLDDHPFNIIIICQQWTEISGDLPLLGTAPLVKWTRQVNLNICSDRKMANDLTVDLQSVHSTDASTCGQSAIETFCYCSAVAHPDLIYYHRVLSLSLIWSIADCPVIKRVSCAHQRNLIDVSLISYWSPVIFFTTICSDQLGTVNDRSDKYFEKDLIRQHSWADSSPLRYWNNQL